jgi:hypothetical protein
MLSEFPDIGFRGIFRQCCAAHKLTKRYLLRNSAIFYHDIAPCSKLYLCTVTDTVKLTGWRGWGLLNS